MSYLLNEMPVVRRRDIVDRLLKINPKEIDLVSQGLKPEEDPSSGDYNDSFIVDSFESFKSKLDQDLPPSRYAKYEDVVYNWAINHEGHSYNDLVGAITAFESEYVNRLRAIDKTPQIFSTSLANSLKLSDIYEMMSLIDEKQRYSRKDMSAKDDSKFNAIGIYPLHVDFTVGDNLSRFVMEFIEGKHQIMIVKPLNTSGSIFWAKANLFGNHQGVESAYELYNELDLEDKIDEYDFSNLIQMEKNHPGTVNWCTSTGSVTGNMFLGYAAGQNRHLYYTFNPFKDYNDTSRRFCSGPLWGSGDSYVPLEDRKDENHVTGGTYVNSKNQTFSLKQAIKEWNKYSSRALENVNKNLSQNKNTECRQEAAKQTFEGFLTKCKSLPVMQSIVYKVTLASVYRTVKKDDDFLKNKDAELLKNYLEAEKSALTLTLPGHPLTRDGFKNLGININAMWRDFLKEKGILRLKNELVLDSYSYYNPKDVLEGFVNLIINSVIKAIFYEFDSKVGLLENKKRTEDLLEIYNIIHKKNYKRRYIDDFDVVSQIFGDDLDNDVLEFEDEYRYKDYKKEINTNLGKAEEEIKNLEDSVKSAFLFIESGFQKQSKEDFVDKLSYYMGEDSYIKNYKESLIKKLDDSDNKIGYKTAYEQGLINHSGLVRELCSYSGLNFEKTIEACLNTKGTSSEINEKINKSIDYDVFRYSGKWNNDTELLKGAFSNINTICKKIIELKEYLYSNREFLSFVNDNYKSDKKLDLSEYYKLCLENIEYFEKSASFTERIENFLIKMAENFNDVSIEVNSNNRSKPKQFIEMRSLNYNIKYEGIDKHVNLGMLTKTADIEFIASISNYLNRIAEFESSKLQKNRFKKIGINDLYKSLEDTKYSIVSSEDIKRNFNSFVDYIFDKKSFNKTYKKISRLTEPVEYLKDDMYWEMIFDSGMDRIKESFPKIISEIGYLLQENIENRFSNTRVSYIDTDDPDAYGTVKIKNLDILDMPLSRAAVERALEKHFTEDIDWDDQFMNTDLSEIGNVIKECNLVPEDLSASMKNFYPWLIVK